MSTTIKRNIGIVLCLLYIFFSSLRCLFFCYQTECICGRATDYCWKASKKKFWKNKIKCFMLLITIAKQFLIYVLFPSAGAASKVSKTTRAKKCFRKISLIPWNSDPMICTEFQSISYWLSNLSAMTYTQQTQILFSNSHVFLDNISHSP